MSIFERLLADLTAYAERQDDSTSNATETEANSESAAERKGGERGGKQKQEQQQAGLVKWSKHLKHEDPDFSSTFQEVCQRLSDYFDTDVFAKRLNYYRDGSDWKPFHHDSHAYAKGLGKEDFTIGASFGTERQLEFLHEPSGAVMSFPQRNGDVR